MAVAGLGFALLAASFPLPSARAQQRPVQIKLGTVMPAGTSYDRSLLEMGQAWRDATSGAVRLTVYPGGRQGGESDMVRKMRVGQLDAAMLSAVGLSDIDKSVTCVQYMPMVFRSWDELDYVFRKLEPQLENKLYDKGFVVLFWGEAGWVRYFSKTAALRPAEFKKLKIFVWSGDNYQSDLMKDMGYTPVPLETSDILTSLQTGMITAAPAIPFFALAAQIDGAAPHMLDLKWAPLSGATVVRKETWDKLDRPTQDALKKAATATADRMRPRSRQEDEESIAAMRKRGLQVHPATPEVEAEWRQLAEGLYPKIRGNMVPADMFDEVMRLLKEYRGAKGSGK